MFLTYDSQTDKLVISLFDFGNGLVCLSLVPPGENTDGLGLISSSEIVPRSRNARAATRGRARDQRRHENSSFASVVR
jgi:hypothetical protein